MAARAESMDGAAALWTLEALKIAPINSDGLTVSPTEDRERYRPRHRPSTALLSASKLRKCISVYSLEHSQDKRWAVG
jgi:hypothetical protein